MNFKDFNKKCQQIAAMQTSQIDQLVSEATDLIMEAEFSDKDGNRIPINWQDIENDMRKKIAESKESGDMEQHFAFLFSLIGMLEVFRRMTEE